MASKDVGQEPQQIGHLDPNEKEKTCYHWVFVTTKGNDIDVHVTPMGQNLYTIDTPWYRAQLRTYDLLESIVGFCQAIYGVGTLTVVIT